MDSVHSLKMKGGHHRTASVAFVVPPKLRENNRLARGPLAVTDTYPTLLLKTENFPMAFAELRVYFTVKVEALVYVVLFQVNSVLSPPLRRASPIIKVQSSQVSLNTSKYALMHFAVPLMRQIRIGVLTDMKEFIGPKSHVYKIRYNLTEFSAGHI